MNAEFTTPELPSAGLLAELDTEERRLLSSYGTFKALKEGDVVIRERDRQDSLYFVISGTLHATHEDNGKRVLLGRIPAGQWFGEVNIFDPASASATVTVREYTQLWQISRADLEEYLNRYPNAGSRLLLGIAGVLARRVRQLDSKLAIASALSAVRSET